MVEPFFDPVVAMHEPGEITDLLHAWGAGDQSAADRVFALVYDELAGLAHRQLRRERSGHTLNTGGLVHEAYFRLAGLDAARWQNRAQFFALAARAMRQVLIRYAVERKALKRGGGQVPLPLEDVVASAGERSEQLLALDEALQRLEAAEPRYARVIECRVFAGLDIEETAEALHISTATVKRDWTMARAWLNKELTG